jgi:hypothetical protein
MGNSSFWIPAHRLGLAYHWRDELMRQLRHMDDAYALTNARSTLKQAVDHDLYWQRSVTWLKPVAALMRLSGVAHIYGFWMCFRYEGTNQPASCAQNVTHVSLSDDPEFDGSADASLSLTNLLLRLLDEPSTLASTRSASNSGAFEN